MNLKNEIAITIRTARKAAGLTQTQLAKKLKWSQSAVAQVESGSRSIGMDVVENVANALKCDVRILLESRENKGK